MRALVLATVLGVSASSVAGHAYGQPVVHKEGEYTGVNPGKAPPEEAKGALRRAVPKGALSWVGFSAKDGGAEVFLQSATKFEVSQEMDGTTLVVKLAGLSRQVTNTRRPIDTRFFDNPLARITAQPGKRTKKSKGRGVDVRIVFKNPKAARPGTLRTTTEADGLYYAYLSFPEDADSAVIPSSPADRPSTRDVLDGAADSLDEPETPRSPVTSPSEAEEDAGPALPAEDDEVPDQPTKKTKSSKSPAKKTVKKGAQLK